MTNNTKNKGKLIYCEYHPRTKAKHACLSCGEPVCEKCYEESGGDCMSCPPAEYHKI